MSMRRLPLLLALLCAALLMAPAPSSAEEGEVKPGDRITWITELAKGFERAKEKQRILMICINAKYVDGRNRLEPAAKGLREIVYLDVNVVKRSREFVCVFLDRGGSSSDFGELRALGVEGHIVSPQHIFVHPDGEKILVREEYWSYGSGASAVKKLTEMMDEAQSKLKAATETPEGPDGGGEAPDGGGMDPAPGAPPPAPDAGAEADEDHAKARAEWIQQMIDKVLNGSADDREAACTALVTHDDKGDCVAPLVALIPLHIKKREPMVIDIVRAVGVPGLEIAAEEVGKLLKHKERLVRGNAAVTLEYIGSKASMKALKSRVTREKDEAIANHMYRALGRCGANDSGVRGLLLKKAEGAKSEFASLGPIIGLAYFDKDKKARRAVEKLLKKMGIPGGRRGGFTNVVKRGVVGLTLGQIGDAKSGKFVREELLAATENMQSRWTGMLRGFYEAIAKKCEGDEEAMSDIEETVGRAMSRASLGQSLSDEMRKGRDTTKFEPMFEWLGGRED